MYVIATTYSVTWQFTSVLKLKTDIFRNALTCTQNTQLQDCSVLVSSLGQSVRQSLQWIVALSASMPASCCCLALKLQKRWSDILHASEGYKRGTNRAEADRLQRSNVRTVSAAGRIRTTIEQQWKENVKLSFWTQFAVELHANIKEAFKDCKNSLLVKGSVISRLPNLICVVYTNSKPARPALLMWRQTRWSGRTRKDLDSTQNELTAL